jgi:putative ABC transport system permease protein
MAIPLKYNIRNLFVRKVSTTMTVFSIGLVVAVFIALMSLATGIDKTFTASGDPRNLLVLRKSAQVEGQSAVTKAEYQILRYLPGIDPGAGGQPLVSPEVIVLVNISRRNQGGSANVVVRGVGPEAFELRPQLHIVAGRLHRPGFREMIVSRQLAGRFENTGIGSRMKFGKGMWTVVGHFEAEGTAFDSEMWADVNELISEFDRRGYSSVLLRCADPNIQKSLITQVADDRRMQLEALSERAYYEKQTIAGVGIKLLATVMTLFMGIGACFAAMNTMYAAVANRTREIGTLRALGFSRPSILISFLIEAVLLAFTGGLVGSLLALPVNGMSTGSANFVTFSEITYNFRITFPLVVTALALSGFLGVLGGFFPARSAARQPIIEALRSV